MQSIVVAIVVAGAVGYASYRIYRALTDENEACRGCALAEKCHKSKRKCQNERVGK